MANEQVTVTRVEVIDATGRVYARRDVKVRLSYQDGGRTLKIFVSEEKPASEAARHAGK